MIAYQFDAAGLYLGETEADESPLEPGVFLVPARCTLVPPPANVPEGRCPRFNGSRWDLVNCPVAQNTPSPLHKLARFLEQNPDVAALLDTAATRSL